ncbi:MAG: hypothetical protein Ct9H300mP25_08370 [Acidobacteriota bacterium]|nr:MAG: hypothetical protein Ct9H300mP25_08370 [Acidobacteriota bacterium]
MYKPPLVFGDGVLSIWHSRAWQLQFFLEESDGHNSIIALLATAVVVLLASPRERMGFRPCSIVSIIEIVFDYRRALVRFFS